MQRTHTLKDFDFIKQIQEILKKGTTQVNSSGCLIESSNGYKGTKSRKPTFQESTKTFALFWFCCEFNEDIFAQS